MGRTFFRQDTQIRQSDTYNDAVAAGATMESATTNVEDDLNCLRSQMKRMNWADSVGNWYDDIQTVNSKKRGIKDLNTDLDDIEEKRVLFRSQIITDITVTAAQNWEVLSVAGGEAPAETAAVGVVTTNGAVVASVAGAFNAHSLNEVAGPNAISPKNLVLVRDATTGEPIMSVGKEVYGLIQSEIATDGHTFNDVNQRVQISFVKENGTADDLIACPVGDIAGKSINYSYVRRINFDAIPEWAWLTGAFLDQNASTDVTRQLAYDNQGTTPVELGTDADLDLALTKAWAIRDAANADLLNITEGSGAGASVVQIGTDVDTFDVNAQVNDFAKGLTVDSAGVDLQLGITANANVATIDTLAGNDLRLMGTREMYLDDGNQAGSTWAQVLGIKLSDTTTEWDNFETAFGEVSLLNAIVQAANPPSSRGTKVYANVTSTTTKDNDVGGIGGGTNLDAQLPNMSGGTFTTDYDVFLNGALLRPGANAAANNDYYPGTSLPNGQLMFEFTVKVNDVICVIPYA